MALTCGLVLLLCKVLLLLHVLLVLVGLVLLLLLQLLQGRLLQLLHVEAGQLGCRTATHTGPQCQTTVSGDSVSVWAQ
jgi:hypothetical protein